MLITTLHKPILTCFKKCVLDLGEAFDPLNFLGVLKFDITRESYYSNKTYKANFMLNILNNI